jgi:hypothetical protein
MDDEDVSIVVVKDASKSPLLVKVSRRRISNDPSVLVTMNCTRDVIPHKGMFDSPTGASACFAGDSSDKVLGLGLQWEDGSLLVAKFSNSTEQSAGDLSINQYKLNLIIGVNTQFLHAILGLQTCSSTFCCAKYQITLKDLREERYFESFPLRTRQIFNDGLSNVSRASTWGEKRKRAPNNGSVIGLSLVHIDFLRVMFPVIHVIIGITMSIYMNLVSDVQAVEAEFLKGYRMLSETQDNLTIYAAHLQKEYKKVKEQLQ